MLALHDRSLFREPVEAWPYGPIAPKIYHKFRKFGGNQITASRKDYRDHFDECELDIMEQVVNAYGDYTGLQLSSLTHKHGSPWDTTMTVLGPNAIISNDLIKLYYRSLVSARRPHR